MPRYRFKVKVLVTQSCPVVCNSMDCSLPGSSVHGILQARILERVAIPFSRGVFLTQGLNLSLPHGRHIFYHLRKIEGRRRRGWQTMRQLDRITDSMDVSLGKRRETVRTENPGVLQSMGSQCQTQFSNWTTRRNRCEHSGWLSGKESACYVGSIPGSGRSPGVMTTHSSILAWGMLWTEEPGGL